MVLISSIFTGAKTVHDRYSLAYVDSPKCSYYALMRFVSDSRYNWALLLRLIAKAAVSIIMKLNDILMSIPQFLLAVSISAALGSGIVNTALAVSISSIPRFARLMRAEVLTTKCKEFVEAARAFGAGNSRIILRPVIPNSLASTIINISMSIGSSILAISSLSFIGLGVQPPTPEWGSILANGRAYIRDFWPLATFPGIAIIITLIAFNLLGDGLRDAMDPKLKR